VASVARGRTVAAGVEALVVPGSGLVKEQVQYTIHYAPYTILTKKCY